MPISCIKKVEEVFEVLDKLYRDDYITEWEKRFINDQVARIEKYGESTTFSIKQDETIDEIYNKACKSPY